MHGHAPPHAARDCKYWRRWPSPAYASAPTGGPGGSLRQAAGLVSDEVELYHRTYTTLLRSSGETLLRVLEPSHRSMSSSLHGLGGLARARPRRVPLRQRAASRRRSGRARVVVVGKEAEVFARQGIGPIEEWTRLEAPARRRRWFDDGHGTMAVLLCVLLGPRRPGSRHSSPTRSR